jgi:hypothetical protein
MIATSGAIASSRWTAVLPFSPGWIVKAGCKVVIAALALTEPKSRPARAQTN